MKERKKNAFACLRLGANWSWHSWHMTYKLILCCCARGNDSISVLSCLWQRSTHYGKSHYYDRNCIRMAVSRKMPFIGFFLFLNSFQQLWKAQTDRSKVQASPRDKWVYFSCHSPNVVKGLYLLFDLFSTVTVVMAMARIMKVNFIIKHTTHALLRPVLSLKMAGTSSVIRAL